MKRLVFIFALLFLSGSCIWGCGKKQGGEEDVQEPISMEELTAINSATQASSAGQASTLPPEANQVSKETPVSLPPTGPYKPTVRQIQIALRNAGYYFGAIDGKVGPLTKGAIEKFQRANNLKVDAKVGPKTWGVLSRYLNSPQAGGSRKR